MMTMRARYESAAGYTPPRIGAALAGVVTDGYWLDDTRYLFWVTELDDSRQLGIQPRIADAERGTVAPAVVEPGASEAAAALYSPDGRYACFLREHNVWLKDRAGGVERQLTIDGMRYYAYGENPESGVGPVSMRMHPVPQGLWSADSEWFVTHRIDERHLPESALVENVPAGGGRPVAHVFKIAGPDNEPPLVEYVAYHVPTGRSISARSRRVIALTFSPFVFRQCWFAGGELFFLDWNRFSSEVSLVAMDLTDGAIRTVMSEQAATGWLDVQPQILGQPLIRPLTSSGELIWYSQRDGWGHLYLHDLANGSLKQRITQGEWAVREVVYVDEAARRVLFLASGFAGDADPGHRRLCAINLDGTCFRILLDTGDVAVAASSLSAGSQLTPNRPSYASGGASAGGRYVVAKLGAADKATRTVLIEVDTGRTTPLAEVQIESHWSAPKPMPFEALAADGVTKLYGAMYFPSDFDPARHYPVVDYIYPGPQINWFLRSFPNSIALMVQSVAELGMVGIVLETRGMPNRDRAFLQAGKGQLHEPQLSDHVAVIAQLCARFKFLDRSKVGIFGQSGGGHAAARAMFDYPNVFRAGVAASGSHDARNYIAFWLDKYGGRPGTPERDGQSNLEVARNLQGKLLLMHGDMDDNVHPGHTLALSAALIAAGKDFEQLIVPGATHSLLFESPYALQRLWNFFVRHLLEATPPEGFALNWTSADFTAGMRMMELA